MAYLIIKSSKIKGSTMFKKLILGTCELKNLNEKIGMNKRLYPNDLITVFKEVKLDGEKRWK